MTEVERDRSAAVKDELRRNFEKFTPNSSLGLWKDIEAR